MAGMFGDMKAGSSRSSAGKASACRVEAVDVHLESRGSTTERPLVSPAEAWDRHPHQLT
jgi:hypothetical protein